MSPFLNETCSRDEEQKMVLFGMWPFYSRSTRQSDLWKWFAVGPSPTHSWQSGVLLVSRRISPRRCLLSCVSKFDDRAIGSWWGRRCRAGPRSSATIKRERDDGNDEVMSRMRLFSLGNATKRHRISSFVKGRLQKRLDGVAFLQLGLASRIRKPAQEV